MTEVPVSLPINLGQLLKVAGAAGSGGDAKSLILSGGVQVNGKTEQRRGRKLLAGDIVEVSGMVLRVKDRGAMGDPEGAEARSAERGGPGALAANAGTAGNRRSPPDSPRRRGA